MNDGRIWRAELCEWNLPNGARWHLCEGFEFKAYLDCWVLDKDYDDSLILRPDMSLPLGHKWFSRNLTLARAEVQSITHSEDADGCPCIKMIAFEGSVNFIIDSSFTSSDDEYPGLRFEGMLKPMFYFHYTPVPIGRNYPSFRHIEHRWKIKRIFLYPKKDEEEYVEVSHVDARRKVFSDWSAKSYFLECEAVDPVRRFYRIEASFGTSYIWGKGGDASIGEVVQGHNELEDRFMKWNGKYKELFEMIKKEDPFWEDNRLTASDEEIINFDQEGLELARELKSMVGDDVEFLYVPLGSSPVKL